MSPFTRGGPSFRSRREPLPSAALSATKCRSSEKRQLTLSTAGKSATCLEFQLLRSSPIQ
jgi:hypothetical protein